MRSWPHNPFVMNNLSVRKASAVSSADHIRDATPLPSEVTSSGADTRPLSSLKVPSSPEPLHQQFPGRAILDPHKQREIVRLTKGPTLNPESARFGQLSKLHGHLDSTTTSLGSAALLRDILHPPNTLAEVEARRAAIKELRENDTLRASLEEALKSTQKTFLRGKSVEETALLTLAPDLADTSRKNLGFFRTMGEKIRTWLNAGNDMPRRISSLGKLLRSIENCPRPESPVLQLAFDDVKTALNSPEREILDGKAVVGLGSVGTRPSTPWYKPTFRVTGNLFNMEEHPVLATVALSVGVNLAALTAPAAADIVKLAMQPLTATACLLMFARGFIVTSKTDLKLQERVTRMPELLKAVDAIGRLDALLALAKFETRLGSSGCHPELRQSSTFRASYRSMRNPVVDLEKVCVPNDIEVGNGKVVILTGPNSGGKSTIATGLMQNQVLAQLGTKVFADHASLTVADQILYQGPTFKALGKHGKFGTEVEAVRNIFHRAQPTSLVVLDEVGDGTSQREGARQSLATLWGFNKLGVGTVVVTHNRDLAKRLVKRGIGEPYQMGSTGDSPNYQLVSGISPESNAERVAKALRFSPEDIRKYVRQRNGDS